MSGWIQDITQRKQAELNLKAALSEIKKSPLGQPLGHKGFPMNAEK
jgi:hypothetical protein